MKHPRETSCYCKACGKHTMHAVSIYKKGKERTLAEGRRRYDRKLRGYGSQPKPIFHRNSKVNKRTMPMLTCRECGSKCFAKAQRLKKFELV
nr:50S ribosomal protein L44e [Candidatus Sigynarchaeota archaeon]